MIKIITLAIVFGMIYKLYKDNVITPVDKEQKGKK